MHTAYVTGKLYTKFSFLSYSSPILCSSRIQKELRNHWCKKGQSNVGAKSNQMLLSWFRVTSEDTV